MNLPPPTPAYDKTNESETRRILMVADQVNRKTTQDVEIGKERLILKSPNGTRYSVTVDNSGNLSTTSL